ncbi:MAG: FliI/YscN family ATPase [bacterium]|nr:FliI/YscN family ATPase [bacterium]
MPPEVAVAARKASLFGRRGRISRVVGLTLEATGPRALVGELCRVQRTGNGTLLAEVTGFRDGRTLLTPLGDPGGVGPGNLVEAAGCVLGIPVGPGLLGRVVDGLGRPIDSLGPLEVTSWRAVDSPAPPAMDRPPIGLPLPTGVKAIDGVLTCGRGQRMGIFAGSGVGKSTLLGMMARFTEAEVNVIALIGERGREVREFLDRDLGEEGRKRSVVVAATSDQPALVRIKAAMVATAIAEYFRDQGKHVLLTMDSLTRFAMAQREVGLANGEPPAARGYTPSVFSMLPRLLERAGCSPAGSITGFYTVLVEGDDTMEPVADSLRAILDGHVVLSRDLAARGHYPPIDVLLSISRLMPEVVDEGTLRSALEVRKVLAVYREAEDLINIGAYAPGQNPAIDHACRHIGPVLEFLRQDRDERAGFEATGTALKGLFGEEGT